MTATIRRELGSDIAYQVTTGEVIALRLEDGDGDTAEIAFDRVQTLQLIEDIDAAAGLARAANLATLRKLVTDVRAALGADDAEGLLAVAQGVVRATADLTTAAEQLAAEGNRQAARIAELTAELAEARGDHGKVADHATVLLLQIAGLEERLEDMAEAMSKAEAQANTMADIIARMGGVA